MLGCTGGARECLIPELLPDTRGNRAPQLTLYFSINALLASCSTLTTLSAPLCSCVGCVCGCVLAAVSKRAAH
jgi:hypothetical protein